MNTILHAGLSFHAGNGFDGGEVSSAGDRNAMAGEVIVSQWGHEAEIIKYLSQSPLRQGIILDMGGILPAHIRQNHPCVVAGECVSSAATLVIDRIAYQLAQTWHGEDTGPKYKNISVGDMIANEVTLWLISAVKQSAILEHLCKKEMPEALVIVDDGSPLFRIMACIADTYGLTVRTLPQNSGKGALTKKAREKSLRSVFSGIIQHTYERFHAVRNALAHAALTFRPGFQHPKGLRTVLFDPYHSYERLIPQLFGCACERILIPCPEVRSLPRIRYYQDVFGVPTGYFHWNDSRKISSDADKLVGELKEYALKLGEREFLPEMENVTVVWTALRGVFWEYCVPLIRNACADIDAAERIIRKHRIDATVLPFDEGGLPKALALVGRRDGLLTVKYQHGVANRLPFLVPPSAEKIVVWNESSRMFFHSRGVAEDRLAVLPNPLVSVLDLKLRQADKGQIRRKLGIPEMQSIVLFAGTPFCGLSALDHPEDTSRILADMLDVASKMPEFHIIIKLHPNVANDKEVRSVRKLVEERGLDNVVVLMSGNTHQLILASDVVVAETSTILWEAVVLNRPAVSFVNREFIRQIFPYGSDSGVIRVDSPEALIKVLREKIGQIGTSTPTPPHSAIKM